MRNAALLVASILSLRAHLELCLRRIHNIVSEAQQASFLHEWLQ
jgi:hypothetical protein